MSSSDPLRVSEGEVLGCVLEGVLVRDVCVYEVCVWCGGGIGCVV